MIKIAVYGVGLIGGSLALCFKGRSGLYVVGHSDNPQSVEKYLRRGVVDHATTSFAEAAQDADFIFLCVPVSRIEPYLRRLAELPLKPGCIITDVGSTKQSVAACARQLRFASGVHFIGGHPMAGSERSGVEAATADLFENAFYVLTPERTTPPEVYRRLSDLLEYTRAKIVSIDAELHDDIVGAISHLPHIIAVELVNLVAEHNRSNDLYQRLAAGGFRDITRIASSDPLLWRDILLNNREVLLRLLEQWNGQIAEFIALLKNGDGDGIVSRFRSANAFRSQIPERTKGMIAPQFDIYVDVPDHPGIIGQIATLLGKRNINLSNIQIIESREDVPGVLRLSFRNAADMESAMDALEQNGYNVQSYR